MYSVSGRRVSRIIKFGFVKNRLTNFRFRISSRHLSGDGDGLSEVSIDVSNQGKRWQWLKLDWRTYLIFRLRSIDVYRLGIRLLLRVVHGLARRRVVALSGELAVVTAASDGFRESRGKADCGEEGEHELHDGSCWDQNV